MAETQLKKTDRVRMIGPNNFCGSKTGKVVDPPDANGLIRVRRDGLKRADTWHAKNWEKVSPGSPGAS